MYIRTSPYCIALTVFFKAVHGQNDLKFGGDLQDNLLFFLPYLDIGPKGAKFPLISSHVDVHFVRLYVCMSICPYVLPPDVALWTE
jgi:hypothetical protein